MHIKLILFFLAFILFIMGTDGYIIAGVLNEISVTSGVSITIAGQLITVFSITFAIFSPILATLFGNINRKKIVFMALFIFVIGNLIVALDTNYYIIATGRIISALSASIITPTCIVIAGSFAKDNNRGKYVAFVFSGITVSMVIGVPIGIFLSSMMSYRVIFIMLSILSVVMSIVTYFLLPSIEMHSKVSLKLPPALSRW